MDNFYEDGWLEQAYEDRYYLPDDEGDLYDYCDECGEHFLDCMCEYDEEG